VCNIDKDCGDQIVKGLCPIFIILSLIDQMDDLIFIGQVKEHHKLYS
jgi:hypothetical protein